MGHVNGTGVHFTRPTGDFFLESLEMCEGVIEELSLLHPTRETGKAS